MFCRKCGAENPEGAMFCKDCGTSFKREQEQEIFVKAEPAKKNKTVYFIVGGAVILLAIIAAMFIGMESKKTREYESYLDTADKYVAELDYEQAQDYYLKAIAVAPKKLEPYVKLAEVYMDIGETEAAEQILEKAEEAGAKGATEEIEQLKESIEYNISAYKLFAEKISEYEEKYGISEENSHDGWNSYLTGLCFMKLIDFDQNGQEELLLIYAEKGDGFSTMNTAYEFEIWGAEKEELVLLDKGNEVMEYGSGGAVVYLTEYEGMKYLVTGWETDEGVFNYHGYLNNEFGTVRNEVREWKNDRFVNTLDGKEMNEDTFLEDHHKWMGNSESYCLLHGEECGCDMTRGVIEETKRKLASFLSEVQSAESQNSESSIIGE